MAPSVRYQEGNDPTPVSFKAAGLYWLQYAVMGNSVALNISRSITERPLTEMASEIYWKNDILDKQLQVQEAVKIAQQEENIINVCKLLNKNGQAVYTLNGTVEKARVIMGLESTADTLSILNATTPISFKEKQVVLLTTPTISKETHDAIIDTAKTHRRYNNQAQTIDSVFK